MTIQTDMTISKQQSLSLEVLFYLTVAPLDSDTTLPGQTPATESSDVRAATVVPVVLAGASSSPAPQILTCNSHRFMSVWMTNFSKISDISILFLWIYWLVSIPVELTQVHIMFNLILDEDVFSQRHNLLFYYHRRFCPIVFFDNYTFI